MDNDAETTTDVPVANVYSNSMIEATTKTKINFPKETTVVAVKSSLKEKIETELSSNIISSVNSTIVSKHSVESTENVKLPPLNNVNDAPKIPSDNSSPTTLFDNCVIKDHCGDGSEISIKHSKIADAMENQKLTEEPTTELTLTMSTLNDDTCASVSNKVSEHCENSTNDSTQFLNVDENCKLLGAENSKGENEEGRKATSILKEEAPSINTAEDINDRLACAERDVSELCQNTADNKSIETVVKSNNDKQLTNTNEKCNGKTVECSEGSNSEKESVKQPSNHECVEMINVESLESRKEDSVVKSSGSSEGINVVTIDKISREESSYINVEDRSNMKNKIIEVMDVEGDSRKRSKNNLSEEMPVEPKRRRLSKSVSSPYSPPLPATPKGGRGRGRGEFEVTDKHLEPFKLGWLREVVERATCSNAKRMWDVYYRSPDGAKKMRSMPDVINYLRLHPESGLTHENFTFFKKHIYREPFELTRKAKERPHFVKSPTKTPKREKDKTPKHKKDKTPQKIEENKSIQLMSTEKQDAAKIIICNEEEPAVKKLKLALSEDKSITKVKPVVNMPKRKRPSKKYIAAIPNQYTSKKAHRAMTSKSPTPNVYEKVYRTKPRNDYSRSSRPSSNTRSETANNADEKENTADGDTSVFKSSLSDKLNKIIIKITNGEDTNKISKRSNEASMIDVNLCSNRCPGCVGEIPSLQCIVCLCLFHPKCMGLSKASTNFICKRCNTSKINRNLPQDKLCKNDNTETQSSSTKSTEQIDSDSTDEDSPTNVSVLAPEVVIQHEGSDLEDVVVPTTIPYCFPNASTGPTNTIAASGQYSNLVLNSKSTFIRPAPPLTPFPTLIPAPHLQSHLLPSKRIVASSTYFPPPPISDASIIRISSTSYNSLSKVHLTTTNTRPKVSSTSVGSPLVGNPPVCSSVRLISPQLLSTIKPPPLGIPRPPALVPGGSINTGPPPLRLVAPTSIASNVGNCNRIVLPTNDGSCLVLTPQSSMLAPRATTRLIGPFPSNSIPQFMVVKNKVIYVNPLGNQQLPDQRSLSVVTSVASVTQPLTVSSSKDAVPETRTTYINSQQNNPCLAALLNANENITTIKGATIKPTNVTFSSSSSPISTVTIIEGKISSTVAPKLTAVIPPSFPVLKNPSILNCPNTLATTTVTCPLSTLPIVSGNGSLLQSPYSNKSYTQEERYKLCLPVTQTAVLTDGVSPSLLNTNMSKRMETSTTPAIKSPMTTARLLTGTESSLSFPEAKSKSLNDKCYDSSSERNAKRIKLDVPSSSSSSLSVDNQCTSESLKDNSSMETEQNSLLGEHAYSNVTFDSMRDQPFRTSAFAPSFTSIMNTMTSCYSGLNNIFQYLTVTDLLRVKLVCKSWYRLASQQFLWRKVSLKNLIIVDWRKFAFAVELHGTTYLDLRGHVLFHDTWQNFVSVLSRLDKLRHVECGLIPAFVLYAMASKLVNLKSLTGECAMFSHWTTGRVGPCMINFNLLENFREMEKFRLRCKEGLMATVMGGLLPISHLSKLRHLSLTTLENVDCEQFNFLQKLSNLESLEIGDCSNWTSAIYAHIGKMVNLHTLRLEKGGEAVDGLGDALSNLKRLKELHLVIYKIPVSLGRILQRLENLRVLSVWPDTATNGPFQNCKVMHVVRSLTHLKELRWVILSDNCDKPDKAVTEEGNSWRNRLEDCEECQIDFSHPNSDIPLLPLAEFKKIEKSLPLLKNTPRCPSINGLRESLQEALPSTTIKMFQVPTKQLRKYSAFR